MTSRGWTIIIRIVKATPIPEKTLRLDNLGLEPESMMIPAAKAKHYFSVVFPATRLKAISSNKFIFHLSQTTKNSTQRR